ncbi:DUF3883 domain-containing protein [Agromyces intestinalis]|uniref:DUF3883 domain-containing protein n=1 Tax=Agromyces intestinalis TaxID=2592652 RepID=A0A5C1YHX8_9MICO|nr:DUF3883 domain-containing protein [Agromyces intestinalis]QEO15816.1 DUF3883 domain-containing protein [Agromyces intestinalis]
MPINNWWESDPAERYWMEVRTEPIGFGEYLLAPQFDGGGNPKWTYTLVSHVQPGDRIFHWDKRGRNAPAIVGWSEAVGPLEVVEKWSWQARGTRGRERGVPTEGPAWRMPLANYTPLDSPVTRDIINARHAEVVAVLNEVAGGITGRPYAPFYEYNSTDIRAAQGYLTKFPAALVALFFGGLAADASTSTRRSTPVPSSQGYLSDAEKRSAIERHSVRIAISHYEALGATHIEERGKPYDLLVVLDGIERHVEVKGSIGIDVESVQLTQGEVDHARDHHATDLFVVDRIVARRAYDGTIVASGGEIRFWVDWTPEDRALRPTHLRYSLPTAHA